MPDYGKEFLDMGEQYRELKWQEYGQEVENSKNCEHKPCPPFIPDHRLLSDDTHPHIPDNREWNGLNSRVNFALVIGIIALIFATLVAVWLIVVFR